SPREVDRDLGCAGSRVEIDERDAHPLGLVDARPGLPRAGPGLPREPFHFAAHAVAQGLLIGRLPRQPRVLLLEVVTVASLHIEEARRENAVQLDDAPSHGLEEVAVVTHSEEPLGFALQELFEPEDALDIE